jgi:hypothetical protein
MAVLKTDLWLLRAAMLASAIYFPCELNFCWTAEKKQTAWKYIPDGIICVANNYFLPNVRLLSDCF